jgi:FMN hydrolase / 5-amino-6-(5-phospho-D-ribitylamino)uracil phosphatase
VSARLVTFDGDDTLWAVEPPFAGALRASCAAFARHFPERPVTIEELNDDRRVVHASMPPGGDLRAYRVAAFQRRIDLLGGGPDGLADELCDAFLELRSSLIEPFPDTVPALERVASRAVVALISNGNADIEKSPLAGRFAFRLHAFEHGPEKPDIEMFVVALARAGVSVQAAVHVGDSLECDVAGAQAAGFKAVWLNREGVANTSGLEPDAEIASLAELDSVVDALVPWRA